MWKSEKRTSMWPVNVLVETCHSPGTRFSSLSRCAARERHRRRPGTSKRTRPFSWWIILTMVHSATHRCGPVEVDSIEDLATGPHGVQNRNSATQEKKRVVQAHSHLGAKMQATGMPAAATGFNCRTMLLEGQDSCQYRSGSMNSSSAFETAWLERGPLDWIPFPTH